MLSWWVNTSSCSIAHFMNTILFCSTDLGAIKHIFNGVLNFRYLYGLVKYRGYGDSGVRSFIQVGWLERHPGHLKFSPRLLSRKISSCLERHLEMAFVK